MKNIVSLLGLALLASCQSPNSTASLDNVPLWATDQLVVERSSTGLKDWARTQHIKVMDSLKTGGKEWHLVQTPTRSAEELRSFATSLQGINSLDFNYQLDLPQSSSNEQPPDRNQFYRNRDRDGWWRRLTGVESAWKMSLGSGTRVAYIDLGFKSDHPEVSHRLKFQGTHNFVSPYKEQSPQKIDQPEGTHGMASILVGFAERDNERPSAGVAPNATVMPYVANDIWSGLKALQAAIQVKPHVMGMNFAFGLFPQWEGIPLFSQYTAMKAVLKEVNDAGIPLVSPAHNYGEPIEGGPREWFPINQHRRFPQIVPVAGMVLDKETPRAWFHSGLLTGFNARGSNFGDGLIWGPSQDLDIASTDPLSVLPGNMSGTSATCPFMTGVIALIKSRLPNVSTAKIKEALLKTAIPIDASALYGQPEKTVPMVQADKALAYLHPNPASLQLKTFEGGYLRQSNQSWFYESPTQRFKLRPTLVNLYPGAEHPLKDQPVKIQGWTGIVPLASDELEPYSIEVFRVPNL